MPDYHEPPEYLVLCERCYSGFAPDAAEYDCVVLVGHCERCGTPIGEWCKRPARTPYAVLVAP